MQPAILLLAATILRVHYPATAGELSLRGSAPLDWGREHALDEVEPGVFEARFDDDATPREVKPMFRGRWSLGANYVLTPGKTHDIWPRYVQERGRVVQLELGRKVWVYLPASYDEHPTRRYPVWYGTDGQNVFDATRGSGSAVTWSADKAVDASHNEAIIVAISHGGTQRTSEYTPTAGGRNGGGAAAHLAWIEGSVKSAIDRRYRTRPDRSSTTIFGSSLGGLFASYAVATRPSVFGAAAAFSPSAWWDGRVINGYVSALANSAVRPERVYVDCGTERDGRADTETLVSAWRRLGYESDRLTFVIDPAGQHNEASWSHRFPAAFDALSR